MRVKAFYSGNQAISASSFCLSIAFSLLFVFLFTGCRKSNAETPVMPPVTHPLVRDYIGYGVVNISFTHLMSEPGSAGVSGAYLRRGTIIRIIRRQPAVNAGKSSSWVFVEGNYQSGSSPSQGWLEEATVDIYDSESRALTASKALSQ